MSMDFKSLAMTPMVPGATGRPLNWREVSVNSETYACLKILIVARRRKSAIGIGDEGGFAPPIYRPTEALDLLVQAIADAGHTGKIKIGIDAASQSSEKDGTYNIGYKTGDSEVMSGKQLAELYTDLLAKYPIVLPEDSFGQDDWSAWTEFKKSWSMELVGDDLLATNMERVRMAEEKGACNSLLLKINQIGSITEAIEAYVMWIDPRFVASVRSPELTHPSQCERSFQNRLVSLRVPSLRGDNRQLHRRSHCCSADGASQVRRSFLGRASREVQSVDGH
jgi:enolase